MNSSIMISNIGGGSAGLAIFRQPVDRHGQLIGEPTQVGQVVPGEFETVSLEDGTCLFLRPAPAEGALAQEGTVAAAEGERWQQGDERPADAAYAATDGAAAQEKVDA